MSGSVLPEPGARRAALRLEFAALFLGAPLLMAAFFGSYSLFAVIWLLAGVALALLALTPGWRWRDLLRGPVLAEWPLILGFSLLSGATIAALVWWITPASFLAMPRWRPELWLLIMIAYPALSALPQELIFRTLFFERYGQLFPSKWTAILANGALFGLGHLFYMNPITIGSTAIGGAVIGWAYLRGRSTALAWILHAISGQLIFTLGLGRFFYSGAVG
mgnify:CR=1 FL=1